MSATDREHLKIFAGSSNRSLTEALCGHLDLPVGQSTVDRFPDGELLVRLHEDVRGRDCYVVQSTCDPVNSNLVELLIHLDCLRRASAKRITAVIPYFGYARQDRTDEDIPVDHLTAAPVLLAHFQAIRRELGDCVVVSPDVGNVKVANMYANALGFDLAIIDKRRRSGTEVLLKSLIGEVEGRSVLMFDDMISTGGTICEAARLVIDRGAREVHAACTHAVMAGLAPQRLADAPIQRVVVTDTIPSGGRLASLGERLVELSVATLLGEAIHRIHHDQSVSAMFRTGVGTKR
jgi:ribose-phosphate pyrophosphokinase